jgi:hypothetical protein
VLSNRKIWPLLADGFVGVRMDWEQGNHFRDKFGFVLGTGDQLLLEPDATPIPPAGGKNVYGRHGEDITVDVLSRARRIAGTKGLIAELRLDWFLWPRKPSSKRQGGFYPPPVDAAAQYARLPIIEIDGTIPPALRDSAFLRRHLRQFIWKQGDSEGEPTIRIRRARDGLPAGFATELANLRGDQLEADNLSKALDGAWLSYMENRPLTARGYLENKHGGWMRQVAPQMLSEDTSLREQARSGTLMPPGRRRP